MNKGIISVCVLRQETAAQCFSTPTKESFDSTFSLHFGLILADGQVILL